MKDLFTPDEIEALKTSSNRATYFIAARENWITVSANFYFCLDHIMKFEGRILIPGNLEITANEFRRRLEYSADRKKNYGTPAGIINKLNQLHAEYHIDRTD